MQWVKLMHVNTIRAKGRTYHYHRKTGERLPGDPEERARRVIEINGEKPERTTGSTGSFAELVCRFRASPEFTELSPETKRGYDRHLQGIADAWGGKQVRLLKRKNVRYHRDLIAEKTTRAADYRITVLKRLLNFGIDYDDDLYGNINPALRFKTIHRGDGYQPWPDSVIEAFRKAAYPELRRIALGGILGTGQRPQDAPGLSWVHRERGGILVRQQKTRELLWLPETREFRRAVEEAPRVASVIFTTKTGLAWTGNYLRHEISRTLEGIGAVGYGSHGLRVKSANLLFEAGCEMDDIAAVLGHSTMKMAQHYTRQADRAKRAVARMDQKRILQNSRPATAKPGQDS